MGFLDRPLTRGFRDVPTRFDEGNSLPFPPPYGGINLRDDVSSLQPNQARILENWLPDGGSLKIRPGFTSHGTGVGSGDIPTLAVHQSVSSDQFFAAGGGDIYEVNSAGVGVELTTNLNAFTSDRWATANYGNRLLWVNDATTSDDDPVHYRTVDVEGATQANPVVITSTSHGISNGTVVIFRDVGGMTDLNGNAFTVANVATNTFELSGTDGTGFGAYTSGGYAGAIEVTAWSGTGLTVENLVNIAVVRDRVWFCEKDSADVWYGAVGAVTGTVTKFQLSQIASGGFCMAIGSWSRDAGDGQDDLTVFVMSTGQIIIYQGDPASTFTLVGKYGDDDSAPPIGRRCLVKVGGELVIITRLGLLPVSAAMSAASSLDFSILEPWGKIAALIRDEAVKTGDTAGWSGALHNGILYITIPQTSTSLTKHIVLVTRTGAFTVYTGWNASHIRAYNNELYFGAKTGGLVRRVRDGDDNGVTVIATVRGAFLTPTGNRTNVFTAVRPRIQAQSDVTGFIGVDTDFFERRLVGNTVTFVEEVDTSPWGDGTKGNNIGSDWGAPWGSKPEPIAKWFSVNGDGRNVAIKMQVFSGGAETKWLATDVLYKPGGVKG